MCYNEAGLIRRIDNRAEAAAPGGDAFRIGFSFREGNDPAVGGEVPQYKLGDSVISHGGIVPCVSPIF
jgi:hypothetical protein